MSQGAHDADSSLDPQARVIAITGAHSFLGSALIRRLEEDPNCARILALDICKPNLALEKTEYVALDLTLPTADSDMVKLLEAHHVDTVVHAAFLSYPTHASEWAHELEDVGTMHVLNACARLRPSRVIMCSTTLVYGASASNPNFIQEDAELRATADSRFINDKVRAEEQFRRFADENQELAVSVLRFAPIMGPSVTNWFTRFFSRPVAPVMMGRDPLLQFLHERDAIAALVRAVATGPRGPLNVVGRGVLPYTTVLALMGKLQVPLPHVVARSLSRVLWMTQVMDTPPSFLDYIRYLCVADGSRAETELGFTPRYGIKRTVLDFLGVGSGADDGAPDITRAQG